MTYISKPDYISMLLAIKPVNSKKWRDKRPDWWGKAVQTAFLKVISQRDPALASQISQPNQRHPYSVSSLIGYDPRRPDFDHEYLVRFTAIEAQTAQCLRAEALEGAFSPGNLIELNYQSFSIQRAMWDAEQDQRAQVGLWPEFNARFDLVDPARIDHFWLEFQSPTYFKTAQSNGQYEPFPFPPLLFGQLAELWEVYVNEPLPAEINQIVGGSLRAAATESLRTHLHPERKKGNQTICRVGITGRIRYDFITANPEIRRTLLKLAQFSYFTGVGKATSVGCGQVAMTL